MDSNEKFDYLFKIVLIGDTNVGKTNILSRLISDKFLEKTKPTIGVEFGTKFYNFEESTVKAQIWDTAGQERYHAIVSAYYRGATAAVIVYDVTSKDSFKNATELWHKNVREYCRGEIPIMIIGNKSDLKPQAVKKEVARDAALSKDCAFFETSAQSGSNVAAAFEEFIDKIYQKEKDKNYLKNKRYARREDLKGEELELVRKNNKKGCC